MALGCLWWRSHAQLAHNLHTYNLLTQAWHLATWSVTWRGRRGTYGTGLALVACSVPTCPSGRRGFLRGRRGTWRHSSSFHVAGVVYSSSFHVAGVVLDLLTYNLFTHNLLTRNLLTHNLHTTCTHTTYSRRRGTWRHGASLCVAGVARMALGWLWWRARFPRARVVAAAFCVAGVALGDIHLRFLLSPCYLYLSFAACWKKLTCGVIRSFNLQLWCGNGYRKISHHLPAKISTVRVRLHRGASPCRAGSSHIARCHQPGGGHASLKMEAP